MTKNRGTRRLFFFVFPLVFIALYGVVHLAQRVWFLMPPLPPVAKPHKANALDAAFVVGANLPWVNYGQDFGTSAWGHRGISNPMQRALVDAYFADLSAHGVTVVRWFVLCDGRSGLKFDSRGQLAGLDEYVFADLQSALDAAREHSLQLIPVLLDFGFLKTAKFVDGVQAGGRRYLLDTPALQDIFIAKVFVPLLERFGQDDAIAAWEVINEPDWVVSTWRVVPGKQSLPLALMQDFIRKSARAIHTHTRHYATVGGATVRHLSWWQNLGLDVLQFHFYPHIEKHIKYDTPAAQACAGQPCIVGEFPTARGRFSTQYYIATARKQGYRGVFFWSYAQRDPYSDRRAALTGLDTLHKQRQHQH